MLNDIVVAVKFDEYDKVLIEHALHVAKENNNRIILLHIHQTIHMKKAIDEYMYEDPRLHVHDNEESKMTKLEDMIHEMEYDNVIHELYVSNSVSEAINKQLLKKYKVDLLVCGSHFKHSIPERILGSTASRIVNDCLCNITVLKH